MQPGSRLLVMATHLPVMSSGPVICSLVLYIVEALDLAYQPFRPEAKILHGLPDQAPWCQILGDP